MRTNILVTVLATLVSFSAYADDAACKIVVTRTPCPGTKISKEALMPYGGKETFEKKKVEAKDKAGCIAETKSEAAIKRKGLFLKKVAVGTFEGTVVETSTDSADVSTCKPEPK